MMSNDAGKLTAITICGFLASALLATIAMLGPSYEYGTPVPSRPIVLVIVLFALTSLVSMAAVWLAARLESTSSVALRVMFTFAIVFRAVQIPAPPFLEIDLYRYMWDGKVVVDGQSPYRFSPAEALSTSALPADREHRAILDLANRSPSNHQILSRIHYPEYTTIYPPISQAVFAAAMAVVPEHASVWLHRTAMKLVLTLFDVGVLLVLIGMMVQIGVKPTWAMVYGWNPLVVKEIANSGHLDSIATFLMMLAVYGVVMCMQRNLSSWQRGSWIALICFALGAGVGAKIFPILLAPLIVAAFWFQRQRWSAMIVAIGIAVVSAVSFGPMLVSIAHHQDRQQGDAASASKEGLTSFLSRWRMNDLAFSFIYENANPNLPELKNRPWYVFTTDRQRADWARVVEGWSADRLRGADPAFLTARLVTLGLFAVVYAWSLWRFAWNPTAHGFLETGLLVLGSFFFLQPTQNPWYWTWVVPLTCISRNRAWQLVSVALFLYYLRFWFNLHSFQFQIGGIPYSKSGIFDHWIVWLEHLPVLLLIAIQYAFSPRSVATATTPEASVK